MAGDPEPIESTIRRLEDERYAAMITGDAETLGRLLSDRLVYSHSNAEQDSKASYLQRVKDKTFVYERIDHPISRLLITPDMVVVLGTMVAHAYWSGEVRILNNSAAAVWAREDSVWRLIAYQPTPIPALTHDDATETT